MDTSAQTDSLTHRIRSYKKKKRKEKEKNSKNELELKIFRHNPWNKKEPQPYQNSHHYIN